jgi:hypothetical protein
MPVYFMSTFLLPKWVIKELNKIRRRFLWHGHKVDQIATKPICLVNWQIDTMSKKNGGLRIRNLEKNELIAHCKMDMTMVQK